MAERTNRSIALPVRQSMEAVEMSSPRDVKMKEEWDNMGGTDCEAALSMPWPIKSEPDVGLCFSDPQSHPIETGCCGLDSSGNEVKVLDIKSEIESCSVGGSENECKPLDIKTEIKSELTEEYQPSELTRCVADSPENHVMPKEESIVGDEPGSDAQKDAEGSMNIKSLEEMQEVECDAEVLMPKKKRKRSDRGRDKGPFPCPTCGISFTLRCNLSKHKVVHSKEKPHACHLCGKSFSRSDYLKNHMLIHTTGKGKKRNRGPKASCDVCGKTFADVFVLRHHQRRHFEDRPFKCDLCSKEFKVRPDFLLHRQAHTGVNSFRSYMCKTCGQHFTRLQSLQKHQIVHTGETPFSCPHCQKEFKSKWGLTCHLKKCTDTQPLWRPPIKPRPIRPRRHGCPHCQKKFQMKWILERHLVTCKVALMFGSDVQKDAKASVNKESLEERPETECDADVVMPKKSHQDGRSSSSKADEAAETLPESSRKRRGRKKGTDRRKEEGPFPCLTCGKSFKIQSSLSRHKNRHARDESDRVSCDVCGKSFIGVLALRHHQKRHTAEAKASVNKESQEERQETVCDTDAVMPKKSHQDGHGSDSEADEAAEVVPESSRKRRGRRKTNDRHEDKGPFSCPTCGKSFKFQTSLYKHEIRHGRDKSGRASCDVCRKSFVNVLALRHHQKRHTEDRPFKCHQCSKEFKVRQDFTSHMKTHTGLKPYVCKECGQGFTRAHSLQKHLRAHTGEMPFSCSHCQKKFQTKWGLSSHLKKYRCTQMDNSWCAPIMPRPTVPKQHCCPQCKKKFKLKRILTRHMEKCEVALTLS
ncbi:zinc finger protein 808-like [Engraulis encrasicolus]|uniref:zinc finger protein 808-like n=1 Tax=Engraulis encrasicolus TaxID=184585 RepID=UPI002FCFC7D0